MRAAILALSLLLASAAAAAQEDYSGVYTSRHPASGSAITLELEQDAERKVTGTLSGNGASFDVEGLAEAEFLTGAIMSEGSLVLMKAELTGRELRVFLFEPGPDGRPDRATARVLRMEKE